MAYLFIVKAVSGDFHLFPKYIKICILREVDNGNGNNYYFIAPELAQRGDYIVFLIIIQSATTDANISLLLPNVLSEIWTELISSLLFYIHNQTLISDDDSPFFLSHPVSFLSLFLCTLCLQKVNKIKIKITAYLMEFTRDSDKVLLSMEIITYVKGHLKVIKYTSSNHSSILYVSFA